MPVGEERVVYITGHNDRRRPIKWLFAVCVILILAANFLDQTSKIDELKVCLRRSETMLKEVERSHLRLLGKLASETQQEPEGVGRNMSVIARLRPSDPPVFAVAPAPTTESGWEDMFVTCTDIDEQGWDETETGEEQEIYPVRVPYEDTERSLANNRGVARVLRGVPLSRTFKRVMTSTLGYLWDLALRAYRRHGNDGATE
ncbi:hypothetical protein HOY82DRAFT_618432 [Tuber indicum]|nr:hypothetical protein HOY82DRAFT_618432 [Tuber indicum]